jgi:hypothetical protein
MEQPLLALLTLATCPSYANFGAAGFASCVRRTAHRCPTTRILHAKTHAAPASRSTAQRLAPSDVTGSARNPIARVNPAASVANRRCCRPSSLGFSAVPKAAEKVWAGEAGAGEGIRTLDPNLGKILLLCASLIFQRFRFARNGHFCGLCTVFRGQWLRFGSPGPGTA